MRVERSTIRELIAEQALVRPQAIAILAPGRTDLTFDVLWKLIEQARARLRELGIQRADIVASVLPNGPDAATAFLAVSAVATIVPLNPDGTKPEYDALFLDLTPKVLLVPDGAEGTHPAALSARNLKIPVVGVVSGKTAGEFTFEGRTGLAPGSGEFSEPEDFAYILTTSGTTARPKLVPMPQVAVCAAQRIGESSMAFTPADRSLNVSPLFHSLGLLSGLISPLGAGGSVVCLPGFQVTQFFDQLLEFEPTWFAAVPAVLQSILEHAPAHREKLARTRLRLVRTAGASLAHEIVERLEQELRAPVLQVYGMSEAPCIASDRYHSDWKPGCDQKKRGAVGHKLHDGVSILGENGQPLPANESGEIVVRGKWTIPGYYRNEAATASAFENGWFHTGDIGYFDADGFLFVTGRRKEFINRGGEKVSPVEVDEVLQSHPAVAEAVTFAVPDARLGEEIAAAVVLHSENALSVAALQEFAATHLTINKVPRQIVFVPQLPKGPTGKLSRFRMAAELGLDGSREEMARAASGSLFEVHAPEVEQKLAAIFERVLKVPHVGPHDNFFDLGGDSMTALQCLTEIQAAFRSIQLSPALFLWAPSVAQMAAAFLNPAELAHPAEVYPLQPLGSGLPFFLVTPGLEARAIAKRLGPDRPMFGLRVPNLEHMAPPHSMERLAAQCVRALRRFRPSGPYALGGWCSAGVIALEMARQLEEAGERVPLVTLLDARGVLLPPMTPARRRIVRAVRLLGKLRYRLMRPGRTRWMVGSFAARRERSAEERRRKRAGQPKPHAVAGVIALRQYRPRPWSGRMLHLWAADRPRGKFLDPAFEWNHLSPSGFEFHEVPGDHFSMMYEPHVAELARILAAELDRIPVHTHR